MTRPNEPRITMEVLNVSNHEPLSESWSLTGTLDFEITTADDKAVLSFTFCDATNRREAINQCLDQLEKVGEAILIFVAQCRRS